MINRPIESPKSDPWGNHIYKTSETGSHWPNIAPKQNIQQTMFDK